MIDRTPDFLEAQDRVKVGHFTRQGFDIGGVVHVGANDGEEIPYYLRLGAPQVIAFEPQVLEWKHDVDVWLVRCALSDTSCFMQLKIPHHLDGTLDTKCATGLQLIPEMAEHIGWTITPSDTKTVPVVRFDDWARETKFPDSEFKTLVIDVQGMELDVLKGFGKYLDGFDFLNIECSREPLFIGESPAQEIIEWLDRSGFDQDSPIQSHDDIMFIRKGLK